jgi:hypothetical protein
MSFLRGKYQPAEQIIDGSVQTFRGKQVGTNQPVFLHRIVDPLSQENASLFRLLLIFLYSSSPAKEQILDFGQEGDICYAVTQNLPQCLLLREWLLFELDRCGEMQETAIIKREGIGDPTPYELVSQRDRETQLTASPFRDTPIGRVAVESVVQAAGGGEFARILHGEPQTPRAAPIRTVTPVPPEPRSAEVEGCAPTSPEPEISVIVGAECQTGNEFIRPFGNPTGESTVTDLSIGPTIPTVPAAPPGFPTFETDVPGEFTKFFEDSGRHVQRQGPNNLPPVQRPAHALTPLPPSVKGRAPGEFMRFLGNSPADVAISQLRSGPLKAIQPEQLATPREQMPPSEFIRIHSPKNAVEIGTTAEAITAPSSSGSTYPIQIPENSASDTALAPRVNSDRSEMRSSTVAEPSTTDRRSKKSLLFVLLAALVVAVLLVLYVRFRF